jgi:hypothetical protein
VLAPEPPPEPARGAAVGATGTSPAEVDFPFCPVALPPLVPPVELELDPPDVVVLEVLELLLPLVLLFVDVVCPDWVLTPPVPRVAARRRLSAAAASPSDWLYAASGASRHTTATAQKVRVRVRMEGAPP